MIKINENFRNLIPPLSESEYSELEKSLLTEGCREPIIIWKNMIVDGHHRYEICTKYNIPFKTQEIEFQNENEAKVWILTNQLARRNLPEFVRIELALKRKEILLAKGKEKMSEAKKQALTMQREGLSNLDKPYEEPHDTRQIIADNLKVGVGTVARAEVILKQAPEELLDKLRCGNASINEVYKEVKKKTNQAKIQQRRNELAEVGKSIPPDDRWHIWQADIATWQAPKEYDFIITDPPYPKKYIYLYEILAKRALEWLKPDGLVLAMCGQSYLDEVLRLMSQHLKYYWTGCYLTPGQPTPLHTRQVNTTWKPVLIFSRPEANYKGKVFGDMWRSDGSDKELHEWGQSESGMYSIISQVCLPGQSILDPFCGSGTTGVAALKHGCLFDGIDIDENSVNIAKGRLYDAAPKR